MGRKEAESDLKRAEALAVRLSKDHLMARVLADGSVAALSELLFTRAILLGCNEFGFERRFCFEDRHLALIRFFELVSEDDEPEGYVARRPVVR